MMDRACVAAVEASIYAAGYPTGTVGKFLNDVFGPDGI
jgi:hypothetical protein